MSFVKKAIKKVTKFVKKYWIYIAIAAAVFFTAGVATIGFAAFAGGGFTGFMGAVGTTMAAGGSAMLGAVGIGAGAVIPTTAATVAAGTAGTTVGFGAAAGLGAGAGIGAGATGAGSAAGQAAITGAGVTTTGLGAAPVATTVATGGGAVVGGGAATTTGMSMAGVGKVLSGIGAVAGPAMTYLGNKKAGETDPPLASWGVPIGMGDEYYAQQEEAAPQEQVGADALDPVGAQALMPAGAVIPEQGPESMGMEGFGAQPLMAGAV